MPLRSNHEQVEGLEIVIKLANRAHRVNLSITHEFPTMVLANVQHAPNRQVIYATGGYDLWDGGTKLVKPDVDAQEAADWLVEGYMDAKARHALRRRHMSSEVIEHLLTTQRQEIYQVLDQGSDAVLARIIQKYTS